MKELMSKELLEQTHAPEKALELAIAIETGTKNQRSIRSESGSTVAIGGRSHSICNINVRGKDYRGQ